MDRHPDNALDQPGGGTSMKVSINPIQNETSNVSHSPLRNWLLTFVGTLCLVAGIIGIFVPVWPTTCFLLMAAGCYSKSSRRMHRWLMENRWFGLHLKRYQQSGTIDPRVKTVSVASLWISALVSIHVSGGNPYAAVLVVSIALIITLHVVRLPSSVIAERPAADTGTLC